MEEYITIFTKYIKENYDMDNNLIRDKYYHTLRVANLICELARKKELSEDDIKLAFFIGLFHDLGRFYEIKTKNKLHNRSFDHGSYSNKILYNDAFIEQFNFNHDKEIDLIIRKALYFHGKKDLDNRVRTEREELFAKLLRDADKLDIVENRIKKGNLVFNVMPTGYMIRNFMNDCMLDLEFLNNKSDTVIFYLSFLKDLYFEESYQMALDKGLLDMFIDAVEVDNRNQKLFDTLVNKVKEKKIEEKEIPSIKELKKNYWKVM